MTTQAEQPAPQSTAPIALFVYGRLAHTRRTVEALRENALADQSDLFVFADAAKDAAAEPGVASVRAYVQSIVGFRSVTVIQRETNWGVDASVIDGVTKLCHRFGRVIVVEDDIVTSNWFLTYMNDALTIYQSTDNVMQVAGHNFPLLGTQSGVSGFLPFTSSWGWATWQRAWQWFDTEAKGYPRLAHSLSRRRQFNINGAYDHFRLLKEFIQGRTTAWDIRWYLTVFDRSGIVLYPRQSLVDNIGFDGSGEHCPDSDFAGHEVAQVRVCEFPSAEVSEELLLNVQKYLRKARPHGAFFSVRNVYFQRLKGLAAKWLPRKSAKSTNPRSKSPVHE